MAAPITDTERQAIIATLRDTGNVRETARRHGRSVGSVSRIAKDADVSVDRSATKTATEARWADMAAKRAQLASDLLDDAARLRQQLWQPAVERKALVVKDSGEFAGSHVEIVDVHLDEPTFADKQRIMTMAAIAIDKSIRIEEHDSPDTADLSDVEAFSDWMLGGAA